MNKQWLRRGFSVIVLLALSLTSATLEADEREDHAQELVKIAEQRLAEGNEEAALRIANIVLSEFPDTRAANKAKELKRAIEAGAGGKATKSRTIMAGEPDPGKACTWGIIPGGGQFYMANYYSKINNSSRATLSTLSGVGAILAVGFLVGTAIACFIEVPAAPDEPGCTYTYTDWLGCSHTVLTRTGWTCFGFSLLAGAGATDAGCAGLSAFEAKKAQAGGATAIKKPKKPCVTGGR